jgi:hypothetical protein
VGELDSRDGALPVDETHGRCERVGLRVVPDPEVLRRDPAVRRDGGGFAEHERRAAHRASREMDVVPLVRETLDAGVLAHRRDGDAVPQRHASNLQFVKKSGHVL